MQKKKWIVVGIGVVAVIVGILGYSLIHNETETVETMAEVTTPIAEENTTISAEKEPKAEETEPQTEELPDTEEKLENTPDTEQETDILQEDEIETETAEEEETEEELIDDLDATMYATQNVNLRQGTAVTTESLRLVGFAEEVKVTGITVNKQWYRVEDASKGVGFIASSYLSDTKPEQNTSAQQTAQATSDNSSESTQSSGEQSSVPGISQSQMDAIEAYLAAEGQGQGSYVQTGENANPNADGAGHFLNR